MILVLMKQKVAILYLCGDQGGVLVRGQTDTKKGREEHLNPIHRLPQCIPLTLCQQVQQIRKRGQGYVMFYSSSFHLTDPQLIIN